MATAIAKVRSRHTPGRNVSLQSLLREYREELRESARLNADRASTDEQMSDSTNRLCAVERKIATHHGTSALLCYLRLCTLWRDTAIQRSPNEATFARMVADLAAELNLPNVPRITGSMPREGNSYESIIAHYSSVCIALATAAAAAMKRV